MNIFNDLLNRIRVKKRLRKVFKATDEFPDYDEWKELSREEKEKVLKERGWKPIDELLKKT